MLRRSFDRFFLWTSAIFVVVAIAAVAAIQWYAAHEIDAASRAREQQVVENGIAFYTRTLAEKSFPQAYWDDAVVNLDNRFSKDWARDYVGVFFWRTERIDQIATLDRTDRVTFAMIEGAPADGQAVQALRAAVSPLVAEVRAAERRRGRLPLLVELDRNGAAEKPATALPPTTVANAAEQDQPRLQVEGWASQSSALRPIAANGIVKIGSSLYATAVTLVQPDSAVLPLTDRSAIIVLAKKFDDRLLGSIRRDYELSGERLATGPRDPTPGYSRARLRSPTGELLGSIEWPSREPGKELVSRTAPALAVFSILLALAAGLAMRKGIAMARELTESEAHASRMAYSDKLTGLPNRPALEQAFEDMKATRRESGQPFSVMCIDIDRFKSVNDSYGHQAGDALLQQVAARISGLFPPDHLLGRFGGDEFIFLCPAIDSLDAGTAAHRIVTVVSQPFDIDAGRVFVGASVGIVVVDPATDIDAPEALRRADLAMYRAKDQGRSQYAFYDLALDEAAKARRDAQESLRDAIAQGRLPVHYQPQFDDRGRLVGAEALARWAEAEERGISTDAFIRLAEETGLIEGLSTLVMRQVFLDAARWPGLPLSVNLSAVLLRAADFNQRIEALIAETGVEPRQIEFEITEGVLLDQDDDATVKLERLRALGSRIALDDFGTGYCGLSYLHLYPIDAVKIDMSFTALLGKEPRAQALIETIVTLARSLKLEVIAEGVETEAQRQALLAAGCDRFQGYLTGRPMTAEELSAVIEAAPCLTLQQAP